MRLSRSWFSVFLVFVVCCVLCLNSLVVHADNNTNWWELPLDTPEFHSPFGSSDSGVSFSSLADEEPSGDFLPENSSENSSSFDDVQLFDLTEEDYNSGDVSFNFRIGEKYTNDNGSWVFNTKADLWWYSSYGLSGVSRSSTGVFDDFPLSYCQEWRFSSGTNKKLLSVGDKVSVEITNIFSELNIYNQDYDLNDDPLYTHRLDPSALDFRFYAYDLNGQFVDIVSNSKLVYSNGDKTYNLIVDVSDASADVYRLVFFVFPDIFDFSAGDYLDGDDYVYYINFGYENGSINFDFTPEDSTEGLLSGLISWVKGIFETVTNGFANVLNAIVELPQKLWTLISDGLQWLFIPSDDDLEELSNKWNDFVSDRFGLLYDSVIIITDFVTGLYNTMYYSNTKNYIDFPEVTINLVGTDFTFGGWQVPCIPEGFDFLVTTIQGFFAALGLVMFINAMRKRFERNMEGEEH